MKNIAVLMTCFNRKEITKKCLDSLFQFQLELDVFLVDDGSIDGTSELISKYYPQVTLIEGTGELFWNRGMHMAWSNASIKNYDFYVWLNDDVVLYPGAFNEIFDCSSEMSDESIISGVIENNNKVIYGGYDDKKRIITPEGKMKAITYLNGNFVLIPNRVFKILGNLDLKFHHDLGDVDYGLRALEKKIAVVTTTKPIGSCEVNYICRVRLNNTTVYKRFVRLISPLGANPFIRFYFRKKHFGVLDAYLYFFHLIFLNLIPDFINKFLYKNRYI